MSDTCFLTIITINLNNETGLEKTIRSVFSQTITDFEYVIVDGASSDSSVDVIQKYASLPGPQLRWVSEPDEGIYNAMNKGIGMATGTYLEFLNSGDTLASQDVIEKLLLSLQTCGQPSILYGNMLKKMLDGGIHLDRCFAGQDMTFLGFYNGTLNHSPSFVRRDLFEKYGLYDESLRIVSDWKWFMQAIIFGNEKPIYEDLDVVRFDMTGISETNKDLGKAERKKVLSELVPASILVDYEKWAFTIDQMKRLQRYPWAYKMVWLLERCLFRIERWQCKIKRTVHLG